MASVTKRNLLQVWGDVIFAIFLREIKSKSKDKLGVAWSVISPVSFIFALSYVRGRIDGGDTHGIPTFFFMVFGMVLVQFFLGLVGSVSGAIKKNKPLYAFRQVQPISSILAIAGFELMVKFFVIMVIVIATYFLKFEAQVSNILEVILILLRVWLISMSVGIMFALAACYIPEIERVRSLLMRPMFFLSGIFFSLKDISTEYWSLLTWNPMLHAVELSRFAAYPEYGSEGVSYFYLNMVTLVLVFMALACYQISWKQAISR